MKGIKEFLGMKLILKYLSKNRLFILCILDIAVILWIAWYESRIQYEPVLDYNLKSETLKLPLISEIYNTIIVSLGINAIIVIHESWKIKNCDRYKSNLKITYIYFFFIIFCMLWGSFYLFSRDDLGVISQDNILFRLPIWITGMGWFTNVITVTRLYISVCLIHLGICLYYLKLCTNQ